MPVNPKFIQLDAPAPDFSLPSVQGGQVSLSEFQGKKNIVLIFLRGFF